MIYWWLIWVNVCEYGHFQWDLMMIYIGWWYTYPSEKYESQWEGLSHILWKIKNVLNHQSVYIMQISPNHHCFS